MPASKIKHKYLVYEYTIDATGKTLQPEIELPGEVQSILSFRLESNNIDHIYKCTTFGMRIGNQEILPSEFPSKPFLFSLATPSDKRFFPLEEDGIHNLTKDRISFSIKDNGLAGFSPYTVMISFKTVVRE